MTDLGNRLLKKSPNDSQQVLGTLNLIADKRTELTRLWDEKELHLENMLELQLFTREADHIDAATKGHEAVLDLPDLGVCKFVGFLLLLRLQSVSHSIVVFLFKFVERHLAFVFKGFC